MQHYTEAETVEFITTASHDELYEEAANPTRNLDLEARTEDNQGLLYHALKTMLDLRENGEHDEAASCRWRMLAIGRRLTGPAVRLCARGLIQETIRWILAELGPPDEEDDLDRDQLKWVGRSFAHLEAAVRGTGLEAPGPEEGLGLTRAEYLEELEPLWVADRPLSHRSQIYWSLADIGANAND